MLRGRTCLGRALTVASRHASSSALLRRDPALRTTLLLAGLNPLAPPPNLRGSSRPSPVGPSSFPHLQPVPFVAWLFGSGAPPDELPTEDDDAPADVQVLRVASGPAHSLIAYRAWSRQTSDHVERVLSCGANEFSQLGIGYASQEPTRGLMAGFDGSSIKAMACTMGGSFLLVEGPGGHNRLFASGTHARGQLGLGSPADDALPIRDDGSPRNVVLAAQATEVKLAGEASVVELATGLEHALALTGDGRVWATGCNSDGQLGLGDFEDRHTFTPLKTSFRGVRKVLAGGDTSGVLTDNGEVFTWGNSEYCQALHGRQIDQLAAPTAIDSSFLPSDSAIVDVALSGSFSLVLDDGGRVYSAGYGPLGLGSSCPSTATPRRIPSLADIRSIRAGPGYAAAVREDGALFVWGLDSDHGRLGIGGGQAQRHGRHATEPVRVPLDGEVVDVAVGRHSMWVVARGTSS